MPEISVVLPTHNSANLLPAVLDGFRRQTLPQWQFEIVAVDDGSSDDTPQVLNCARAALPVRIFRQRHAGLAAAKNIGLFASRGTTLLFADNDKIPSPELLLTHLSAHKVHPEPQVAILGHTQLAADVESSPVMRHVTQVGGQLFYYAGMKPGLALSHTAFSGGTSCKRQFLIDHGLFLPIFDSGFEYIELGYRLRAFGWQVFYEPAAVCTMIRMFSFRKFCERQERLGRSERAFAELYPTVEVLRYCQIDEGLSLWNERAQHFCAYMRLVERIDKMAQLRADAGRRLRSVEQAVLDDTYRAAFALCRAKGVAVLDCEQSPPR